MDFVPAGWLLFADAVDLFEIARLGARPVLTPDQGVRGAYLRGRLAKMHYQDTQDPERGVIRAVSECIDMSESEFAELKELNRKSEQIQAEVEKRVREARDTLRGHLYRGDLRSALLSHETGRLEPLPGFFWASSVADEAIAGRRCQYELDGALLEGRVLVCKDMLTRLGGALGDDPSACWPLPGEDKQDFIMRFLQLAAPRKISHAEARQVARVWLSAKKSPDDPGSVMAEMKRMTALMRRLA